MPVRETVALLRELDPVGPHRPSPPPRHRAVPRLVAGAAVAVALAFAIVTATGGSGPSPTLAEAAYTALTGPDHVLHLELRSQFFRPKDDPTTTDVFSRGGGERLRVVYDGGKHEFVRDRGRFAASYFRPTNTVTQYTEPEIVAPPRVSELTFMGPEGAGRLASELPALLARARDGDPAVRRLPDTELDGRMTARLETTETVGRAERPGHVVEEARLTTVVWIDLQSHLPRRIERSGPDGPESRIEVRAERLDDADRLLELRAPEDARRVVGGRG